MKTNLAAHCFLLLVVFASINSTSCNTTIGQKQNNPAADPWLRLDNLLKSIKAPAFPNKDFVISKYGAVANNNVDCTEAFKKAIEACNRQGGGRVVVPKGDFHTGPIHLKSNVNLHLEKGARILFSTNPDDYLPLVYTRWEGVELMNYSPLIYAFEQKNIAITGEGILDGQATNANWGPWKGNVNYGFKKGTASQVDADKREALFKMAEKDVPVSQRRFGKGFYLRPQFVQPYRCQNVF